VTAACGGADPTSIQLTIGPFGDTGGTVSGAMTQVSSSKIWTATFGPFFPHHGKAALRFDLTCPSGPPEVENDGYIYVDPSGTITDVCTGKPILGATATLSVESPAGSGTFVTVPASSPPVMPPVNPETTLADGMYAWTAIPGKYEVTAAAPGYVSKTTAPVTIPPAVTGLDISLAPTTPCADIIPPTIVAPAPVTAEATGPLTVVSIGIATGTDEEPDAITITNNTPVAGFPLGATTVTWTATDSHGNSATATQTITIIDTTPPTITGTPSDVAVHAKTKTGVVVTYTNPTATDLVDGSVPVKCTPPSGSTFPIGTTTVTCTATDKSGNTASTTFHVIVTSGHGHGEDDNNEGDHGEHGNHEGGDNHENGKGDVNEKSHDNG
jgi:hypothetical protein